MAASLALAMLAITLVSVVYMSSALRECDSRILGGPGDAAAGGVWAAWTYQKLPGGPTVAETPFTAAPEGEAFWQPQFTAATLVFAPLWAAANVVSPTCAWNALMLSGFVLSGAAMFFFVWWLTRSYPAALFAALAFAFSPYRQYKAGGHITYVHAEFLILLVLACLALWARPTWVRAALAGVALAAACYTDGYYILLGGVTFAVVHAAAAIVHLVSGNRRAVVAVLPRIGASVAVAAVLLVPLALVHLRDGGDVQAAAARSYGDLFVYGSQPWEFVLPAHSHPVTNNFLEDWQESHLHGSNPSEQTLYVGWTVLALLVPVGAAFLRRRREPLGELLARRRPFAAVVLAALGLAAIVWTAPPEVAIGPLRVPMPSKLVFQFVQLWRVYSRFFIVAHIALVALAAMGLALVLRHRTARARWGATALVLVVLGAEFLTSPPHVTVGEAGSWDYDAAPAVYHWLKDQPDIDIVAEYPLYPSSMDPDHHYLSYQPLHGKRLLNVRGAGTRQEDLRRPLYGPGDPQSVSVLRALGVDVLLVHTRYGGAPQGPPPPGLRHVGSYSYDEQVANGPERASVRRSVNWAKDYDVEVYRVDPGPVADAAVALSDDFLGPELDGWSSGQWMQDRADIWVKAFAPGAARAEVTLPIVSGLGTVRRTRVLQSGRVLWEGDIGIQTIPLTFMADVGPGITIETTPGARRIRDFDPNSNDERAVSLWISGPIARALP